MEQVGHRICDARLAAGAQATRDMIVDAWLESANTPIGYPMVNSTSIGASGTVTIPDIQGVKYTQCTYSSNWLDQNGASYLAVTGSGWRNANGNITGIKLFPSSGNFSGTVTLLGSSN
jgi:hypothetical protein